jgi:hypothetical protein
LWNARAWLASRKIESLPSNVKSTDKLRLVQVHVLHNAPQIALVVTIEIPSLLSVSKLIQLSHCYARANRDSESCHHWKPSSSRTWCTVYLQRERIDHGGLQIITFLSREQQQWWHLSHESTLRVLPYSSKGQSPSYLIMSHSSGISIASATSLFRLMMLHVLPVLALLLSTSAEDTSTVAVSVSPHADSKQSGCVTLLKYKDRSCKGR